MAGLAGLGSGVADWTPVEEEITLEVAGCRLAAGEEGTLVVVGCKSAAGEVETSAAVGWLPEGCNQQQELTKRRIDIFQRSSYPCRLKSQII